MKIQLFAPSVWFSANAEFERAAAVPAAAPVKPVHNFVSLFNRAEAESVFDEAFHALAHEMALTALDRDEQEVKPGGEAMMNLTFRKLIWLGLIALGGGLLSGCSVAGYGGQTANPNAAELALNGIVETREVTLGSKVGGRVTHLLVEEGQEVKPDQVLLRFEVTELQAEHAQAVAQTMQQAARLQELLSGARPEERAQAQAATANAQAQYDALRNGARPEELAQSRAVVASAAADVQNGAAWFERMERLLASGDVSRQDYDFARFRLDNLKAKHAAETQRLELLCHGTRAEELRAAAERLRQTQEAERMLLAGPRVETIAQARAQLRQAEARVAQLDARLAEGEVRAPVAARIEAVTARTGDLVAPNAPLIKLLESDQLFVRVYVPEPQLAGVRTGQRALVQLATSEPLKAHVEQINAQGEFTPRHIQSRSERDNYVFGLKVKLDQRLAALKAGMSVSVRLLPDQP